MAFLSVKIQTHMTFIFMFSDHCLTGITTKKTILQCTFFIIYNSTYLFQQQESYQRVL